MLRYEGLSNLYSVKANQQEEYVWRADKGRDKKKKGHKT